MARVLALMCAPVLALHATHVAAAFAPGQSAPATQDRRVAALDPAHPLAYLELAEELADRAPADARGDADRALAIQLAGQAGALDVQALGRSAALFILDVSRDPAQRARMAALAESLGGRAARATARPEPTAVLALLQAFTAYKRGQAGKARTALDARGAAALLDQHPEILAGGAARFRADCDRMKDGVAPVFTSAQSDALHALAGAALAVEPRTWSESLALYGRAPVPDIDLAKPAELFGVTLPATPAPAHGPDRP